MSLKELKNFCPLPFISLFTFNSGSIKICCDSEAIGNLRDSSLREAWNSPLLREVRRSFLKDEKHPVCKKCWQKEDLGLTSARLGHEFNYNHMRSYDDEGFVSSFPRNLSLRLGNICNLKCIMCQPDNSTKWHEDLEIYENFFAEKKEKKIIPPVSLKQIEDWLNSCEEGPRLIYFVGGEPLLSKEFKESIRYLASKSFSKSLIIRVFTNLSVDFDWLFPLASSFDRLEISASVDGVSDHYNYIRFPAKWSDLETRIERLIQNAPENLFLDFFFVAMSINIFNLKNFYDWVSLKDWRRLSPKIYTDILFEPDFLSIKYLSEKSKNNAIKMLQEIKDSDRGQRVILDEIENIQKFLIENISTGKNSSAQNIHLLNYLHALDKKRDINSNFLMENIF